MAVITCSEHSQSLQVTRPHSYTGSDAVSCLVCIPWKRCWNRLQELPLVSHSTVISEHEHLLIWLAEFLSQSWLVDISKKFKYNISCPKGVFCAMFIAHCIAGFAVIKILTAVLRTCGQWTQRLSPGRHLLLHLADMTWSSWQRDVFIFSPLDHRWQRHRCPQHERIYLRLFGHVCWRLDQGCGHFILLNWQIRAVTYALLGGRLATCSGMGCRSACMSLDLEGKLAWPKLYYDLSFDNEISASYYNIPRWWIDSTPCSFTHRVFLSVESSL